MSFSKSSFDIFNKAVDDYHLNNNVDQPLANPYSKKIESILYHKCWIDTVQWHLEDIIRDPEISPEDALAIKRRIDASNQDRTDRVEQLDDYFISEFVPAVTSENARLNTETPAWAIDRLSILCLKVYHMREEAERPGASENHRTKCQSKLDVLLAQQQDLSTAIDQLIFDIKTGRVVMKLYRQMKMYNDPSLNPVLYGTEK